MVPKQKPIPRRFLGRCWCGLSLLFHDLIVEPWWRANGLQNRGWGVVLAPLRGAWKGTRGTEYRSLLCLLWPVANRSQLVHIRDFSLLWEGRSNGGWVYFDVHPKEGCSPSLEEGSMAGRIGNWCHFNPVGWQRDNRKYGQAVQLQSYLPQKGSRTFQSRLPAGDQVFKQTNEPLGTISRLHRNRLMLSVKLFP